jgi:diacylglycerol kinase (ATP)
MRVTLIHNPRSGDDDHSADYLVELVRRAGHDVSYYAAKSGWEAAIDARSELFVAAGGDGTVSEVARATAGRGVPVAILPTGTANNIASWLGLKSAPLEELVAEWPASTRQPFDLGVSRGPWETCRFLESVGLGLLTGMMSKMDEERSHFVNALEGRELRLAAALEVLEHMVKESPPVTCDIQIDDVRVSGDYLLVEILNFGMAGPNLKLAPDADAADGRLDVVLVDVRERAKLEAHVALMRTDPLNAPTLSVHHGRRVSIRCEPCTVHLDDELWPRSGGESSCAAEVEIEPAALTFLVPPPRLAPLTRARTNTAR